MPEDNETHVEEPVVEQPAPFFEPAPAPVEAQPNWGKKKGKRWQPTPEQAAEVDEKERDRLAAVQHKHDEMLKEYNELQALHMKEASESDTVLEKYLHVERTHADVVGTMKKVAPIYVYAPDECRPVPKIAGAQCAQCGWTFGGKRAEDKEPHVTA
jgi:hypothetical protein